MRVPSVCPHSPTAAVRCRCSCQQRSTVGPLSPDVRSKLVVVPLGVLWGRMPFIGEDAEAEITGDQELPRGPSGQSRLRTVVPGR